MILIADSGSTKTDWRYIDKNQHIDQFRCVGINPSYQDVSAIMETLRKDLIPWLGERQLEEIYFYGAGCSSESAKQKVITCFADSNITANIFVEGDMLGAARSLCLDQSGIACILGTGSNTCLYDGEHMVLNHANMGYLLHDLGSGMHLGKNLLRTYMAGQLPQKIEERLQKRFDLNRDAIIQSLYKEAFPNRYLASFSKFIFQNIKDAEMYRLVYHTLEEFLKKEVMTIPDFQKYNVHFSGSVAFYFGNILRQLGNDLGISIRNISETPIAGLALYHVKRMK